MQVVCVLILVNEHISEPALPIAAHVLMLGKELDGEENKVVKVHGVRREQPPGILDICLANFYMARVAHSARGIQILLRANGRIYALRSARGAE